MTKRTRIRWSGPATARVVGETAMHTMVAPMLAFLQAPETITTLPHASPAIRQILAISGTPEVEGAETPKETALGLLRFAAEVEHALLVQYIYAASSLFAGAGGGVNPASKLMLVAEQEMGHLISVQNLLLSVGGPAEFYFGRDSIRATNPENPIPFALEPISHESLAKYVVVEMPGEIPDPALRDRVAKLTVIATQAAGMTPHRVGALYAKLFWLFQPDDNPRPPLNLTPAPDLGLMPGWHIKPADFVDGNTIKNYQADRQTWVRGSTVNFLLSEVTNADSALSLINDISQQGEGLGSAHDSHFFDFLDILTKFEANQLVVTALPVTPVARTAPAPDAKQTTPITTPYAKLWAELFDFRYNFLLLDLWHAMATSTQLQLRSDLIDLAYTNMGFINEITQHLLELRTQLNATDPAPPFALMSEDLPETNQLRWQRHQRLLLAQGEVVHAIQQSPEFQDCSGGQCDILDFNGSITLQNIATSDQTRQALIHAGLAS